MSTQKGLPQAYGFSLIHKDMAFFSLLRPHLWMLLGGAMLLLITSLIMVSLPLLVNAAVGLIERDAPLVVWVGQKTIEFHTIEAVILLIVVAALVGAIFRTLSRMLLFDVGRIIERDVRAKLYFHTSIFDDYFFFTSSVGDLMNHLTTDMNNIRMVVGFAILNIINIIFVFCFTVPLLLKIDVTIALFALLPFPLIALVMSGITRQMFNKTMQYQEQLSNMISHIQENLLGAHVVRLFHQQEREAERFLVINENTYQAGIKLARLRIVMMPVMRFLVGLAVGFVLYLGGKAVFSGRISLGDFVEVNARILQLAWPAMSVGFVMSVLSRGQASLKRVNQVLSYIPTIQDGHQSLTTVGRIDIHNLHLVPSQEGPKDALNFSLEKGQTLAIVGSSGSYKTTLLRALSRRRLIPEGTIFFDGHDVVHLTLASFYQVVSVVPQESYLFNTSILNNLRFARPDVLDEEIDHIVKLVRLDRDIAHFSDGINTIVGERGVTLSGGQKQRVALARALLAKRSILILDDALSAVDKDTEHYIISHLSSVLKDTIVVLATHRLSVCRNANHILVLEKGRVIESGTHEDLVLQQGMYHSLWDIERRFGRAA